MRPVHADDSTRVCRGGRNGEGSASYATLAVGSSGSDSGPHLEQARDLSVRRRRPRLQQRQQQQQQQQQQWKAGVETTGIPRVPACTPRHACDIRAMGQMKYGLQQARTGAGGNGRGGRARGRGACVCVGRLLRHGSCNETDAPVVGTADTGRGGAVVVPRVALGEDCGRGRRGEVDEEGQRTVLPATLFTQWLPIPSPPLPSHNRT